MKKLIVVFILMFSVVSFGEKNQLEVLTFKYSPFMGESILGKEGVMIELVKAAFAEQNVEVNITYLPTKRAISKMTSNKSLAYIGILKTFPPEEREKIEEYYFIKLRFLIFYLKSRFPSGFEFNSYEDLKPYSIGVLPGITEIVGKSNNLKIELAKDIKLVFKKINGGRNDMGIAVDLSIKVLLKELFKNDSEKFGIYEKKPFVSAESTILLNKEHPDYSFYSLKLKKGMKSIVKKGIWLKIMEKYYGKGKVPQESIKLVENEIKNF